MIVVEMIVVCFKNEEQINLPVMDKFHHFSTAGLLFDRVGS